MRSVISKLSLLLILFIVADTIHFRFNHPYLTTTQLWVELWPQGVLFVTFFMGFAWSVGVLDEMLK